METKIRKQRSRKTRGRRDDPLKERILSAAGPRFLHDGFARTSVDQIASELGISKKTLYKNFPSKEELLSACVQLFMMRVHENLARVLRSDMSFVEKLDRLMAMLADVIGKVSKPFQHDLQRHSPELWTRMQEFRRVRVAEVFADVLDQGIQQGSLRRDVHRRVFLLAYLGAIENVVTPSVLVNESFSAGDAVHSILQIFFRGILTDAGRAELAHLHQQPS